MKNLLYKAKDTGAMAVVEATIILPIVFMLFAAMMLLSMYLPQRAILQEAAQYAVNMLAPERSDVGYQFDVGNMSINSSWDFKLHNTWGDVLSGSYDSGNNFWVRTFGWFQKEDDTEKRTIDIVYNKAANSVTFTDADITTTLEIRRTMLYSELVITLTQEIPMPVNLSFIGFPGSLTIKCTARAPISDGDGFIRTVDDVVYFADIERRIGAISGDLAWGLGYVLPFLR